jgi:hypothetical protein
MRTTFKASPITAKAKSVMSLILKHIEIQPSLASPEHINTF